MLTFICKMKYYVIVNVDGVYLIIILNRDFATKGTRFLSRFTFLGWRLSKVEKKVT